jgi:CO/xanthine dehydrogenase Mo-binding subunit
MEEGNKEQFRVIGTRPIRHDAADKVTGRAKYGADFSLPDMLYGKILRSPHAHAKIISINAEKALKIPGVKAVVTSADLRSWPTGVRRPGRCGSIPGC